MSYKNGLFIFHRDLRIADNRGLLQMSECCEKLHLCFIFTPEQFGKTNDYRSNNAVLFMIESLEHLTKEISKNGGRLYVYYGKQSQVLREILREDKIDAVGFNRDYSPYAVSRDEETENLCKFHHIDCKMYSDYYLFEPGSVHNKQGGYYKKFTPFYEEVISSSLKVAPVSHLHVKNLSTNYFPSLSGVKYITTISTMYMKGCRENPDILVRGGREEGLKTLNIACLKQKKYDELRDYMFESTTHLSAYLKFGCISVREAYSGLRNKYGNKSGIIRELIWREFFAHVLYAFPEVLSGSYQPKYREIRWKQNVKWLNAWKRGETGFPIVDAAMREMNQTGYMHNRGRMIVANFLIKTLGLNWREGEKYFAQMLTDYDPASNNGNWQSISGTGVDMRPYFRDMNPWIQSVKFDRDAKYIKKWVPELNAVPAKSIHEWHEYYTHPEYKNVYIHPIVEYDKQKEIVKQLYERYV